MSAVALEPLAGDDPAEVSGYRLRAIEPGSEQYRCSGSTLREFISNGSEELSRQPAVRPTFTSAGS